MLGPALIWKMGGDTSGFNTALDKSSQRTGRFKSLLKSVGGAFSVGLAISGLRQLTAEFDDTAKTARKLDVAPELLQEMRFAADRTGVSQNALDMGLQRFTRRLAEAKQGGGELKGVLQQYDIALQNTDGSTRSNVDVLGDLAEVIKNTKDPSEQLRIAFKAFDSEGAAMVNTLRDGRAGLEALRKEARDTGNVVGGDTLRQFEKLNDQVDTLSGTVKTAVGTMVGAFLTFGERVGQGAAMAVNAIQGIPTVLEDDVPRASESAVASIDRITESVEELQKRTEKLRSIDQIYADFDFKRLSTAEQLNQVQKEYNALNEKALQTTMSSAEGLELHRELAEKFVQLQELKLKMEEESLELSEAQSDVDAERVKSANEYAQVVESTVDSRNEEVGAVVVLNAELAKADLIMQSMLMTSKSVREALQIDTEVEGVDTSDLERRLAYREEQLKKVNDAISKGLTLGNQNLAPKLEGAYLEREIEAINQELQLRERFQTYSAFGDSQLFAQDIDPFQIERLTRITGGLSSEEESRALLADIRDGIQDLNNRY